MQLLVSLNDHQEVAHNEFDLVFDEQSTLNDLQAQISSKLNIEREQLDLFDADGRQIVGIDFNTHLSKMKLNHMDRIIVKHDKLGNWIAFLRSFERAQKALKSKRSVEWDVDSASMQLKALMNSDFFVVYSKFDESRRKFQEEFSFGLNSEFKYIELASKHYFSFVYNDNPACPNLKIKCVQKIKRGLQGGLECHIHQNGTLLKIYHVKIHTRLAKWHDNQSCDLRELFAYKLLELINIGPKVHFYPNFHYSGFGLYIATEDISGFRQEADIPDKNDNRMAQLELLSRCLYLKDLRNNHENYGADDQGNLQIVDFEIGSHSHSSEVVSRKYLSINTQLRIEIGKSSLSSWDLLKNIDLANNAIENQKTLLKNHSITFKSDRILEDYLTNIKNNVNFFTHLFE